MVHIYTEVNHREKWNTHSPWSSWSYLKEKKKLISGDGSQIHHTNIPALVYFVFLAWRFVCFYLYHASQTRANLKQFWKQLTLATGPLLTVGSLLAVTNTALATVPKTLTLCDMLVSGVFACDWLSIFVTYRIELSLGYVWISDLGKCAEISSFSWRMWKHPSSDKLCTDTSR